MPSPEQRFEVPPEYADVYERAYRRAYEEGQGQLNGGLTEAPARRTGSRGKRIAVPEQRSPRRAATQRPPAHLASARAPLPRVAVPRAAHVPAQRVIPPNAVAPPSLPSPPVRVGHRAAPRGGSTLYPVLGLIAVVLLLVVGAFLLGRATAGTVNASTSPPVGTRPAAVASATEGPSQPASSYPAPGPYDGPVAPARIESAKAACGSPRGHAYSAANVLDHDRSTAWRCNGRARGKQLVFTLARTSEVVTVGLAQAYGAHDPITRVVWIFDNGTRVFQTLSGRVRDHSLQQRRVVPMRTDTVTLRILDTARGPRNNTSISTVRLGVAAAGSD